MVLAIRSGSLVPDWIPQKSSWCPRNLLKVTSPPADEVQNFGDGAPWWGGFYERLVKSVKDPLRKILGRALLTYEELSTILIEIELETVDLCD
ncbi:hypothetical protein AVEN_20036-1 [Araneus ventricosus]|uniref:Uncharacterized protein n=1 Tax=Araneus ventricosus TaxID=182803 RepID=A0A4Y2IUV4_ARAVE|nr:hypothetical protein AVEN_20036-1 [Araneus ventricosus]